MSFVVDRHHRDDLRVVALRVGDHPQQLVAPAMRTDDGRLPIVVSRQHGDRRDRRDVVVVQEHVVVFPECVLAAPQAVPYARRRLAVLVLAFQLLQLFLDALVRAEIASGEDVGSRLADRRPRVRDVRLGRVLRAHGEADDVVVA